MLNVETTLVYEGPTDTAWTRILSYMFANVKTKSFGSLVPFKMSI